MRNNLEGIGWRPPTIPIYQSYLNLNNPHPLDLSELSTELLIGVEPRKNLKTPVAGEFSIVVRYKGDEGALSSYEEGTEDDLEVIQVQGGKQAGIRLSQGMRWVEYLADESIGLVKSPATTYTRLVMVDPTQMTGLTNSKNYEGARARYAQFINQAHMRFSKSEQRFVRDFPHKLREI